jgi:monoterpene epsilon-lactone hydrolase
MHADPVALDRWMMANANGRVGVILSVIVYGLMTVGLRGQAAHAEEELAQIEAAEIQADGTLRIVPLTAIPPSDLWSPEFRREYVSLRELLIAAPGAGATKADWDKFLGKIDEDRVSRELARWPVDVADARFGRVRVDIITPREGVAQKNRRRVLINLHSGEGVKKGKIESIPIAAIGKIKVITVDNEKLPSAAIRESAELVYRALLREYRAESIGIFGCGGGGILTAQTIARLQKAGVPRPGAVGIFCAPLLAAPSNKGGDSERLWPVDMFVRRAADRSSKTSAPTDAGAGDAELFPGSDDAVLAKFPPTLWSTGTRSFEMSSVIVAHARLLGLGVESQLYVIEGGSHGAQLLGSGTPEVRNLETYVVHWFDRHLAR